jgi:hypothetical protein
MRGQLRYQKQTTRPVTGTIAKGCATSTRGRAFRDTTGDTLERLTRADHVGVCCGSNVTQPHRVHHCGVLHLRFVRITFAGHARLDVSICCACRAESSQYSSSLLVSDRKCVAAAKSYARRWL